MRVLSEEFQIHETLNPKLFDINTKKLLPQVRDKIIQIVEEFEDYLEVPISIVDVQLTGSNCSYNYTDNSDVDVHIVANFDLVSCDPEILKALYNSKKSSFNKEYDITIKGLEVEMYVQDVKSSTIANGIYSVCDDDWVKEPKPIKSATKHNTEKEFNRWKEEITKILNSTEDTEKKYNDVVDVINSLYLMRANSLAVDGEYGKGNQLFKDIRQAGLLQKLKDEMVKLESKRLSLEDLRKGQLVNRIDY